MNLREIQDFSNHKKLANVFNTKLALVDPMKLIPIQTRFSLKKLLKWLANECNNEDITRYKFTRIPKTFPYSLSIITKDGVCIDGNHNWMVRSIILGDKLLVLKLDTNFYDDLIDNINSIIKKSEVSNPIDPKNNLLMIKPKIAHQEIYNALTEKAALNILNYNGIKTKAGENPIDVCSNILISRFDSFVNHIKSTFGKTRSFDR